MRCDECKHWEVADYCKDFEKGNQSGICSEIIYALEIEYYGDSALYSIITEGDFFCANFEEKTPKE